MHSDNFTDEGVSLHSEGTFFFKYVIPLIVYYNYVLLFLLLIYCSCLLIEHSIQELGTTVNALLKRKT